MISMDRVQKLICEAEKLTIEELQSLFKVLSSRVAVPLRDPKEIYDDWDDKEIDAAYKKRLSQVENNRGNEE